MNHPVVKLEILWNSMAMKEGFFLLVEGRGKKRIIFALCMLQQWGCLWRWGGVGRVARGHGNKCSGAKRGHFHVVAVSVPGRYL